MDGPIAGVTLSGCVLSSIHYAGLSNGGDAVGLLFGGESALAKNLGLSDELSQSSADRRASESVAVDIKGFVVCPQLSPWGRDLSDDAYAAQLEHVVQTYRASRQRTGESFPIVGTFACRQNASLGPSMADAHMQHVLSKVIGGNGGARLVFASFAFEISPLSNTQTVDYKFLEFKPDSRRFTPLDIHIESFSHSSQEEHAQFSSRRKLSANFELQGEETMQIPPFVQDMENTFKTVIGRMEDLIAGLDAPHKQT